MLTTWLFIAYNLFVKIFDYLPNFSWPQLLFSKRLRQPSKETESRVHEIISYVRSSGPDASDILAEMILDLPLHEDILSVCDEHHYNFNLLQIAVEFGHTEIVTQLVQTYGLNCNGHSPPLHLACFCGHDDIVKFFISNGESLEQHSNVSLPVPRKLWMYMRYNCTSSLELSVAREMVKMLTPVQCAILGDQSSCLKQLLAMQQHSVKRWELSYASQWLHLACKHGAADSTWTLLENYPDIVNIPDENGFVPLCNAVHCGEKFVQILLDHGATAKCNSQVNETILHKLYSYIILNSGSFYKTTKCLLTSGLREDINRTNINGDTALNLLVEHMSYRRLAKNVHRLPPSHFVLSWPDYQQEFNECLTLLLEYGASPHLANCDGLQPLNKILHIAFEESVCQNLYGCRTVQPMVCICENLLISQCQINTFIVNSDFEAGHRINFRVLSHAVSTLLVHGADPNTQCKQGHTPLKLWLMCFAYVYPSKLCDESEHVVQILTALLEHGADVNFYASPSFLSKAAAQYFQFPLSVRMQHKRSCYADLVNQCLCIMLKYGFNPNRVSNVRSSYLEGGAGNSLIDFVNLTKMAETCQDFEVLYTWIKTLLQWGADPDIEPYPSGTVIFHSQNSIFLQRLDTQAMSHYVVMVKEYESFFKNDYAENLLRLFYKTMDHKILFGCLSTARSMARFHPLGTTGKEYLSLLKTLTMYPRTLKEIARVSIYKSLGRKVAQNVHNLPLPRPLRKYILDIE